MTAASDASSFTLHSTGTMMDINRIPREYNETYEVHFYETCPECLVMVYETAEHGHFLMNTAEQFLESTATQLSYHGLCERNTTAKEGEISVFFRNNHFSTMIKHKDVAEQKVNEETGSMSEIPNRDTVRLRQSLRFLLLR